MICSEPFASSDLQEMNGFVVLEIDEAIVKNFSKG